MPQYIGIVPWETLGGHAPSNETMRLLLHEFNKTEIITVVSQLNLLATSFHSQVKQLEILHMLAVSRLIDWQSYERLARRIEQKRGSELVITRPGMLELIRAAAVYCSDDNKPAIMKEQPHLGRKFARSLLHAYAQYDNREIVPFLAHCSPDAAAAELELHNRAMAFTMRSTHYTKTTRTPLLSLGRGLVLLKDELFQPNSDHLMRFQAASGGLTLDEYLDCLAAVQSVGLERGKTTSFDQMYLFTVDQLSGNSNSLKRIFEKYLELESQNATQLTCHYKTAVPDTEFFNKKALRTRPIFNIGDGRFVIMDEQLFADRASIGPFFLSIDSKNARQNSFAPFGEACEFFANRLFDDHNQYIRSQGSTELLIKGPQILKSKAQLCDHCLIDGKMIALCETKGVWLKEELLAAKDPEAFWINVKASYATVNEKGKRYGMAQLHHAITSLLNGTLRPEAEEIAINDNTEILPLLIAHDTFMGAPFFAHGLALEFMHMFGFDELPKSGSFMLDGTSVRIHTPIVMSLNDLERLHMMKNSSSFCSYLSEFSHLFPNRMEEFNSFIANKELNSQSRNDDYLQSAARRAINLGLERMFGKNIEK